MTPRRRTIIIVAGLLGACAFAGFALLAEHLGYLGGRKAPYPIHPVTEEQYLSNLREANTSLLLSGFGSSGTLEGRFYRMLANASLLRFDEALDDAQFLLESDPSLILPSYALIGQRGQLFTELGQDADARADADTLLATSGDDAWGLMYATMIYIALEDYGPATSAMTQHRKLEPADAFGALVTYVAMGHAHGESAAQGVLMAYALQNNTDAWPGPVIQSLLGNLSEQEALDAGVAPASDYDTQRNLCEAYYYLGERRLMAGDTEGAAQFFTKAVETGITDYIEYYLALRQLENIGRPFPTR